MSSIAWLDLLRALWETIYMVFISSFLSIVLGTMIGLLLYFTKHPKLTKQTLTYRIVGVVVNIVRSIPFIILMIALIPVTRFVVGASIGTNAAIVSLTVAAIPFFARVSEAAFFELSDGLLDAAYSMGASKWQLITKFILPESLPSLVQGATLTIISLIGYSAMAGAIGGGGLGELAINYGYERFNVSVMLATVVLLVMLVQLVQSSGDWLARKRQIKMVVIASVVLWVACIASQVWPAKIVQGKVLRVGVMAGVQQEIMQVAKNEAKKKYDLNLKIIPFNNYVLPNVALANGDIDANIFQHVPYLNSQIKARGFKLTPIAKTFIYPMGLYSRQIRNLSSLKSGAIVAIPNDPSNEGRALLLLKKAGLIQFHANTDLFATPRDIVNNPLHLKFKLLQAAQLPRVFKDATLVALTNDFVKPAGFTVNQALIRESATSPYANVIVVRTKDQHSPVFHELIAVMHSKAVLKATLKAFPDGAAIPAWKYF